MSNLPVEPNTIADIVIKAGNFLGWLIVPGLMKKRHLNEGKARVDIAIETENYRVSQQKRADILAKFEGILPEVATPTERAISSFLADIQFSQRNREQIGLLTFELLNSWGTPLPEENPLSDELMMRFYRYASDISTEEGQKIWAKVLAGEIARPGSFSLNTLDILRNITQEQAKALISLSKYIFGNGILLQHNTEKKVKPDPFGRKNALGGEQVEVKNACVPNWEHIDADYEKINFMGLIAPKRDFSEFKLEPGVSYDFKLCSGCMSIQIVVHWVGSFFYLPVSKAYFEILSLHGELEYDTDFIHDIVEDLNTWGFKSNIKLNGLDITRKQEQNGYIRGQKYFFN